MATRKSETPTDDQPDLESLPAWKRQSVERSLKSARARAQDRSDRFVNAGIELIRTTGDTGFTVQEVVEESGMSIRTFYLFFASKDDLLLAIHETILASEVAPRLRSRCDAERDPVLKIKVFIDALFEISGTSLPSTRAFMVQQHRLAESRPDDLDRAMEPQVNLILELLAGAVDAGRLRSDIDIESTSQLIHHLTQSVIESRVVGSTKAAELTSDQVWEFCSSAIGASAKVRVPARR
jgi:AcrR family transcriptional regulator